jgi:hypothetical protein
MKLKGEMGAWLAGVWGKSWSKMLVMVVSWLLEFIIVHHLAKVPGQAHAPKMPPNL